MHECLKIYVLFLCNAKYSKHRLIGISFRRANKEWTKSEVSDHATIILYIGGNTDEI